MYVWDYFYFTSFEYHLSILKFLIWLLEEFSEMSTIIILIYLMRKLKLAEVHIASKNYFKVG